jgi:hypothetical protein
MDSVEHKRSRVVCKKMKIDKMAEVRILFRRSRTSAEIASDQNLRANILFAGSERAKHRVIRHDVEVEGWGGSIAGSFSGFEEDKKVFRPARCLQLNPSKLLFAFLYHITIPWLHGQL